MAITGQDLLKRLKQNTTNKSTITGSDLLAARKASGIDQKYIDSFVSDANSFLSSKKTGAASEYDTYTDLSKRSKNISSWLKVNKSKYDEQSVKALTDMLSSFTDSTSAYGQYKDSSDYTRKMSGWLSGGATVTKDTVDLRKGIYNSNAEEIARIEEALPWYEGGNTPDFLENLFMSKSEEELRNQKNRLEAENRQYERTQKAIDDGYIEITPEVLQSASNRDFGNPDRQSLAAEDAKVREIDDGFRMGRYTYDFSGNVVNAYTNELIYAADDPYVKAMREGGEYSPIADKLGVWINSSQDDRDDAYEILASGVNDYWATAVNDGERLYWDQLTPDEVTTYYYYLNTEGQERAYEFLDSLETELGRRATADRAEDIEKASLIEKIALNAASIPQNVLGGVLGAYEDAYNLLYGNEINPYSAAHQMSNDASAIRQSTAKDIDRLTGGTQIPWIEFGFGDAYQALMSRADSFAGGLLLGSTAYGKLAGASAATTTMRDLYERGASGFQIAAVGLIAGAAEDIFEKFSIDNLINLKSAKNISQVFKNALIQGGIEASEETLTEIANAVADGVIMGSESKWTSAEAFAKDVVNAALGGFISGAGMGGGYSAAQNAAYNAQAKSLGEDVINRGEVDALQKLALEMYSAQGGADAKQAVSLSGKIADAKARGKTASATTVGKLADLYAIGKDKQDIETMTKDLTASGLSAAEARKVAEFTARISRGETATPEEISAIEKITNKINIEGLEAEDTASVAPRTIKTVENAPIKEKASEGKISASESNIKKPADTDNISEVIGKVGDKYKVRLKDGTELLDDAAEMSPNTERLFATAKDLGLNAESANAFVKNYDGSMSAADYATAYAEAYRYGAYNFAESEMRSDGFSALLSESQRKIAYESGRIDRKYKTEAKQAEIKKTDKKQSKGKLHNTFAPTNERQKASLKALGVLAEALGIDIYTFESETNAEGKHIGKNGWYDPKDNSIHIDVYAGEQGHDTILFTAAHELTHMTRRWSPEKFKVFADFLMEKYGEQGKSVSELVRAQMSKAEKNGRKLTFDEAYEELVADSCESFLADGEAIAKIAELKAKDKSLWEKIKDYLTKLIARIKAAYEGLEPDSEEGRFVASLLDSAEELRDLWVEAVVDASTAYNEGEIVSIDETSESVSPAFSERTWTQSDYVVHRDEMAKKISEALGVTVAKAKSYIDDINSIAKMIADDRTRLDYEASSFGSAFVSNVEYGGSFDYTTLCKKRRIYTGTFTEIQKRLKDTALSPDDILKIRNLLIEEGVEATCGLCYVEGSRANMGKFAKEFIRLYKRDNPNGWIPNMADVNTPDGVEQMRISHPEVYEQYEYFWNHYGKLKDSDPALFASQQKPKLYEARKEYKGEILEQFSKDTSVAKKNRNGGIRMQSFSDFEIVHLIDTMQVIMDMSTVGLAGQAYTKVPEFALAFGDTGLKINLSLIAKGVDENGKLIFDDREGMPHKTAFDIREKYSKNVGTIIVAFTDEQILAAMADERIDFIIPFHRSQWKKGQYGAMGLPNGTKDYTYQQNEKFIKPTYHEYRGRMVRDKASNYMPNEYWDFSKSGKENAELYLNMCAEENKRPKFYKFLDYDGNGRYSLKEDGSTDGYWKLLIDFKMYDNEGVGSPQEAVVPSFNMDEATKMLDEYKGGHANYPVAQGVVDKFVSEYEGVKYSDRDSSYMDAVNRGDMDTAQRMVDEAAREAGYAVKGFHATNADFTVFDIDKTSDINYHGKGIYFTNSQRDVENNYENYEGPDPWQKIEAEAYELLYDKYGLSYEDTLTSDSEVIEKLNECYDEVIDKFKKTLRRITAYLKFENPLVIGKGENRGDYDLSKYDGIIDNNVYENFGHAGMDENTVHYVVFNPRNIKSADPVTYDDNGNVIPLSQRFNAEDPDIRFSDRSTDTVSNRTLLAEALEGITLNDIEKTKLADYKANAEKLDAAEARLKEVRAEIKEISFSKGTRDKQRLSALKEEATKLTNRINIYDRRLINLEAFSALKGVLDRAKADVKAREKAKAKADLDAYKERSKAREKEIAEAYRESRAANVEGRRKTEMRHKIKGTLKRLTKLLKGGKDRNVKEGMKDTVSTALALGEVLFNNEISNRDIVRLGVESVTEDESKLLNEYHDLLIKKDYNDERIKDIREGKIKPDSRPYLSECEEQNKKIEGRIATLNNKLSDVFIRERTRLNKTTVSTLISNLATEYHDIQNSKDEFIKMAYVPELFTRLIDLKKDMDGVAARDMTLAQLEEVYKTFSMIEHVVTNANKLWRDGKRESLEERRTAIFGEIGAIENAFDRDYAEWIGKTLGKINEWGWNNLRPVDAFELVGSESLTQLFWDVIDAQSVYARDIDEVKNAITSARQKYGYKKWDLSKTKPFEMPDGRTFNITLGEMMSIYAYSKREQADAHMREGGFQHAKGATYKDGKVVKLRKNEHLTYKIDDKLQFDIIRSFTKEHKEQQAYVDDIQKLLTSWGEKGNEASRILYGINLFNEEVYFPLKSSTDYLKSMQTQLGQTATTASLAGSGMAKPTKPHANNPIILQAFDDVVLDHLDRMSKYHAYVVPIDNLRKILDSLGMDTNENMLSIKALIGEKLGDGAREYLLNYITDLNGIASVSGAKNPLENFFGKAKGASVAANLSVWVQQYFSIIRAFSEVNPRYFIPFINAQQTEGDLKVYEEMKKYAPIATIKEMGGFDVGSNRSIKDYVGYEEARVSKGKVAKKMTDAFGVGASLMDRLGWITIWKGIKKEVAASGKYKVGSEEYLKACGKRFEEVIVKTQVYDSVNARSGFMRSKHGAVKYLVSFMGEPTTIAGMAEVSVIKLKRALASKDKEAQKKATAKLVATMGSIAASSIATSLAKSLIYAMRDDDEEENYIEKYAEAFGQAFRDDITLLNYLPIARDIVSLFEGRTIERPDMTLIEDLIDSFRSLTENFVDEDTTSEEWWSDGFKLAGAIANMFGIPAKNIWRDVSGLGRTISNLGSGYKTDVAKNFIEGFTGKEIKKGDDLYTAIVSGDTKRVKHYKSTYKTESAYNSAVRKALRENDPRIKEAAEARYKGRDSEYSRIAKQIVREGNFTQDDVVAAINAEVMAIKKSETAKRTT